MAINNKALIETENVILKPLFDKARTIGDWERILNCELHIVSGTSNINYIYYGNKERDICLFLHEIDFIPYLPKYCKLVCVYKYPQNK